MKDYRLSEIKEICGELHAKYGDCACDECYIGTMCWKVCDESVPKDWDDIEPRDMIELPYKAYRQFSRDWRVIYFDNSRYEVKIKLFTLEAEADKFLQELKNGKV